MPTFKLTIAYDGTGFTGWARQPGLRTVQETVEHAVATILGGRESVDLTVAGRTDAGVHALGQVASFELDREPPDRLANRVNAVLPHDVSVLAVDRAPDGFDARRWATSRSYRYRILTTSVRTPFEHRRSLWHPYPLDRGTLDGCATALVGKHDFTAFTATGTKHRHFERRILSAAWEDECEAVLVFDITADAFLRSMIRVLVGTMLEVGRGLRSVEDFTALLEGAPREHAGETAPPHGLYFAGVTFGDGPVFTHVSQPRNNATVP